MIICIFEWNKQNSEKLGYLPTLWLFSYNPISVFTHAIPELCRETTGDFDFHES